MKRNKTIDSVLTRTFSCLLSVLIAAAVLPIALPKVCATQDYSDIADGYGSSRIIVSMGDSYSSGEGIPPFYGSDTWDVSEKVKNEDWLAHRSQSSWSGMLRLKGMSEYEDMSRYKSDSNDGDWDDGYHWFFVASSGATTHHINHSQRKVYYKQGLLDALGNLMTPFYNPVTNAVVVEPPYKDLEPQIDALKRVEAKKDVDYITFTFGGNDAGFSDIITEAALGSTYLNTSKLADKLNKTWRDFYKKDGIRDNLLKAYRDISNETDAAIIVAGYPQLLDPTGKGLLFSREEATLIDEAVSNFNKAISYAVQQSNDEGINIFFVSVEEAFNGHEAYSDDAYINKVMFGARGDDLIDGDKLVKVEYNENAKDLKDKYKIEPNVVSAYSMHPNENGARAYAECVQEKIDELENEKEQEIRSKIMGHSDEREIVLVLDTSGSMDENMSGSSEDSPIDELKKASNKFIDTVLKEDASIGIVAFSNDAEMYSDFSVNDDYLKSVITTLNASGGTNTGEGLLKAEEMLEKSNAKKKIIVLMSDGLPNVGKQGDDLIEYADSIKEKDIMIYALGFFSYVSQGERPSAEYIMREIASDNGYFNIENAEDIVYFFGDIADEINGQKYIHIRIACPVDVTVRYDGQTLCSKESRLNTRTEFGTLTFEENTEQSEDSTDNRVKILRLKEGVPYEVSIEGNGKGKMSYTISFMDEDGEYKDRRKFSNIKITKNTVIDTVAEIDDTTELKVDEDGDGKYDLTYRAGVNGRGELVDNSFILYIIIGCVSFIAILTVALIIRKKIRRHKQKNI